MTSLAQPGVPPTMENVAQTTPPIAAFDLDETLVNGDCAQLWLEFLMEEGWQIASVHDQCCQLMANYDNGYMDMERYMALWLQPLLGKSIDELSPLLKKFVDQWIAPRIFAEARDELEHHRAQGHLPLIISASPDFLVQAIGRLLDVSDCIAIKVALENGVIAGHCHYPMSYREGKIDCLQQWLQMQDYPQLSKSVRYFYSDSHNDLPLLKQVANPCVVNPDARLAEAAGGRGWRVARWGVSAEVF
ncbi:HAD family hydrolase [Porticoccus sp. W117]|uniref:HAD family hydrolase n=1 Tax=Porticoccus sp. W117 TaxID=3054777 RepID=UPI00259AB9F2|nr:HAD family hydrolase [Porticoccus sp. W117]MDM3870471.1 HAD family hydrolase [Porticoccus sp. W117]